MNEMTQFLSLRAEGVAIRTFSRYQTKILQRCLSNLSLRLLLRKIHLPRQREARELVTLVS